MEPARESALLWGLVGALSFGVLYQGYVLLGADFDWRVLAVGIGLVGAVSAAIAPSAERWVYSTLE